MVEDLPSLRIENAADDIQSLVMPQDVREAKQYSEKEMRELE